MNWHGPTMPTVEDKDGSRTGNCIATVSSTIFFEMAVTISNTAATNWIVRFYRIGNLVVTGSLTGKTAAASRQTLVQVQFIFVASMN